jgi:WD40 repeat protein
MNIHEVLTGKLLYTLQVNENFNRVIFSPDSRLILTTGADHKVYVYDVLTGKERYVLSGHTVGLISAIFSPDGKNILTIGNDQKSILWDVASGKQLYTRLQLENGDWLVYDEHFRFDGTLQARNYLYLVCGLNVIKSTELLNRLYVPNLAGRINKGERLESFPKLSDLKICD